MRNRLQSLPELTDQVEKLHAAACMPAYHGQACLEQQVCLFGPERYEPRYNYPLVVWLHSCRSAERELGCVMPELSLQNYVGCAPRGTVACDPDGVLFDWGKSAASAAIAEEVIFDAIELASSQFSVAEERIFLAGFGSGGTMAWRIALRYPTRFAGVVSICGDYPHQNRALSNVAEARHLPTLWIYGAESKTCGVQQVCDTLPVLHSASLAVDIRQYPCGNELLSNMLVDVNAWLMERVTSQPASPVPTAEESFSRN